MKILELVVFALIALVFAVIEGGFLYDFFSNAAGIDRGAEKFMLGILVVGLLILARWARRLWRLTVRPS